MEATIHSIESSMIKQPKGFQQQPFSTTVSPLVSVLGGRTVFLGKPHLL